ncbi:DinB family protein [Gracilibacillus sp. S3-1-1]|uniref:DinB family protein n=1 Tax=Gracilibacillus pellucidus TaxID=3095368 RepID=A0ACC6M9Q1_9BACI|nr:DinB family protein [Gracilibacillus sp. S3-1-1]MDX8047691.1 DinB family protein [Gracilibacillus sp. S3-1-1]
MKSHHMQAHFQKLYVQRDEMEQKLVAFKGMEWERPLQDKWSWGETYYHLYLMLKNFRRLSKVYIPLTTPVAALRKSKPFTTHSPNIYEAYQAKKKKPMKAPFIIMPPKEIANNVSFDWLIEELNQETNQLEEIVATVPDDIAGHIRFPDPLANNPNLIQSIDLLGIHEKHHFLICDKYYRK